MVFERVCDELLGATVDNDDWCLVTVRRITDEEESIAY
jgi:hypothetical protein